MANPNKSKVRTMVLTAVFAALSIVVGFIEIPWPPMPFLKIDFSEVVVLVSLLMIGYPRTIIVIILRSLVREFSAPKPFEPIPLVGEIMAIFGSIVIISLFRLIFSRRKEKRENFDFYCIAEKESLLMKIFKSFLVAVGFSIFMTALNFFITVPIFLSGTDHLHFVSFVKDSAYVGVTENNYWVYTIFILTNFLPFNLVKGVLTMLVFDIIRGFLTQFYFGDEFKGDDQSDNELLPTVCEDEKLNKEQNEKLYK